MFKIRVIRVSLWTCRTSSKDCNSFIFDKNYRIPEKVISTIAQIFEIKTIWFTNSFEYFQSSLLLKFLIEIQNIFSFLINWPKNHENVSIKWLSKKGAFVEIILHISPIVVQLLSNLITFVFCQFPKFASFQLIGALHEIDDISNAFRISFSFATFNRKFL